ncbi:MAG: hypothetical protein A2Y24_06750 [Clostridiales bacterium GWE2_32_10]|nr:MAG: hypothetical protein A2Y24_06750 [Clostridiales bacterium GWE2_32_10]HBY20993.1 hypothetical protein [Clostridiales bacterium]
MSQSINVATKEAANQMYAQLVSATKNAKEICDAMEQAAVEQKTVLDLEEIIRNQNDKLVILHSREEKYKLLVAELRCTLSDERAGHNAKVNELNSSMKALKETIAFQYIAIADRDKIIEEKNEQLRPFIGNWSKTVSRNRNKLITNQRIAELVNMGLSIKEITYRINQEAGTQFTEKSVRNRISEIRRGINLNN